ncbi:MAG: DUF4296 domain-containing protein [Bacteroidales bacterium]|nr:DUF4296 domain-containing protein [Bacteroidales bacterium]
MFKNTLIISLLLVLCCSCNKTKYSNIIGEDEFTNILVDLHVLEAMALNNDLRQSELPIDSASVYAYLFNKYDINKTDFDSSLYYYAHHTERIVEIYENVYSQLAQMEDEYKNKAEQIDNPSNHFYTESEHFIINGDSTDYPEPFFIPFDTTGRLFVKAKIRLNENDMAKEPYIMGSIVKDTLDVADSIATAQLPMFKSNFMKDYVLYFDVEDTTYQYIKITFPVCENRNGYEYKNIQLTELKAGIMPAELETIE